MESIEDDNQKILVDGSRLVNIYKLILILIANTCMIRKLTTIQ